MLKKSSAFWILMTEFVLLSSSQKDNECVTNTDLQPDNVIITKTNQLKIICKASTILRLQFDRDPLMFIQKITPSGHVTMATLDGNDTVTKFVENIDIIGFFPTNFQVIIRNPTCSDVTRYECGVNVTNSTCASSGKTARLARTNNQRTGGPPRLSVLPLKEYYTEGDMVVLECSAAFLPARRLFIWNWFHPLGKAFPRGNRSQRLEDSDFTCNRTSSVTLTLEADDNGAQVVCLTGAAITFRSIITLRVARKGNTPQPSGTDKVLIKPPQDWVPAYSLGILTILVLLAALLLYTAVLLAGGTKLKFPFRNCFRKKDHLYEIPNRGSAIEIENRYYSLKGVQPIYVNAPDVQQRDYEDVNNSSE